MSSKKFETEIGGRKLSAEFGKLAGQTNASVLSRYGDTVVLVTCVMKEEAREGVNYLPLTINYEEKLYAAGKIKGSRFIKREGRPTEEAILNGRIIDRAIRPLFNQKIRNEIQIVTTVLSFDEECDPVFPALFGVSVALSVSNIPWNGPIGGIFLGWNGQKFIVNPGNGEKEKSLLNFVITGTKEKINMIEGGAKEVPEKTIVDMLNFSKNFNCSSR